MKCRINPRDTLHPKVKKIASDVALEYANHEFCKKAERLRLRHEKMAILALHELGWGTKRLKDFQAKLDEQIQRVEHFDGDMSDFDFKIDSEVKKLGLEFAKM